MEIVKPSLSLVGFRQSMLLAFQEALVDCNQPLIHALETASAGWVKKMMYDCDTDPAMDYVDSIDLEGWTLRHLVNGKSVLVPLNAGPRQDEIKDIVCFFKMHGMWHPVLMRSNGAFGKNRFIAGQLFAFIHMLWSDGNCNSLQAFYETSFLDSAETVLLVEPEVIDWILADNKKEG